jgi:4'-phosphopantetheinyl transferase
MSSTAFDFVSRGEMSAATVRVWNLLLATRGDHERWLSPDEREQASRFRFSRDRQSFAATRSALRQILGTILEVAPHRVEFGRHPGGKPRLLGQPAHAGVRFNVSHSADRALIAVAWDREVGVDLEPVRPCPEALALAQRHFAPAELRQLLLAEASDVTRTFLRLWTRKEAVLKAAGTGLTDDLSLTDTTVEPLAGQRWQVLDLAPAPDHVGALAVEGTGWRLNIMNWPADV